MTTPPDVTALVAALEELVERERRRYSGLPEAQRFFERNNHKALAALCAYRRMILDYIKQQEAARPDLTCYECNGPLSGPYCPSCNPTPGELMREAMGALGPFAEAADEWHEMGDSRPIDNACPHDGMLTVGDLRRARSIHSKLKAVLTGHREGEDG